VGNEYNKLSSVCNYFGKTEIKMARKKGFTLIELLVVIAIIALLLAIILPSLKAAKELASGAVCVNNQKQLSLAWISYASDNKSLLVGGSNYFNRANATPYRWVEVPLLNDKDNPETVARAPEAQYSLQTRKNGIRAGRLFPYTQNEALYHCPGDKGFTHPEPTAEYRSYSISGLMNSEDFIDRVSGLYSPIKTYRSAATSPGGAKQTLYNVVKISEIKSPGNKYVFVEEDVVTRNPPQKVNDGGFVLLAGDQYGWWDRTAYFHNDSSTFGFADGHAERHRWHDPDTLALMKDGTTDPHPETNEDLMWLVQGYLPKP
jgi:prepilin-type N-terminal cleavage/methylation domain-containing protein/prepilin-type processing-associated H-X9-DG protein